MAPWKHLGVLVMVLGLAACAHGGKGGRQAAIPNPHLKVGTPYKINGITYVPRVDPDYDEVGIASWYGPQFHGKLTANGELFDMHRLTAAHKTLPLPSLVRVTNLENGRSAVLRLNDRGPFAGNRIIDLSKAAAERLGSKKQGLAKMRVEYLGPARLEDAITRVGARENHAALKPRLARPAAKSATVTTTTVTASIAPSVVKASWSATPKASVPAGYFVQVGAFQSAQNARAAAGRLPNMIPVVIQAVPSGNTALHQVRLGPYAHNFAAREAKKVAREAGFADAHIVGRGQLD